MDDFYTALVSADKNELIPNECDWFKALLGDWDFDYSDISGTVAKGEWIFRRVLNGMAIEDLFICPSRATREENPNPDSEYGAALRMYNTKTKHYDMTYICESYTKRLEVDFKDNMIICTVLEKPDEKWVFSEISNRSFHWRNVNILENGNWQTNANIFARRREKDND